MELLSRALAATAATAEAIGSLPRDSVIGVLPPHPIVNAQFTNYVRRMLSVIRFMNMTRMAISELEACTSVYI